MTTSRGWIEALMVRIQEAFLDEPGLQLTVNQARQRFGVEGAACEAVLAALVEASVLARTPGGAYVRFIPDATAGNHRAWPASRTAA